MNRREFLGCVGGLTASTTVFANIPLIISEVFKEAQELMTNHIIYDDRSYHAKVFANTLAKNKHHTYNVKDDVTPLWMERLRPEWVNNTSNIAGMSSPQIFFCLSQLARDYNMYLMHHSEHNIGMESIEHSLIKSQLINLSSFNQISKNKNWARQLARLLKHQPLDQLANNDLSTNKPIELVSWVFSPRIS